MFRFFLTRLFLIVLALGAANAIGYTYALVARQVQKAQNPYGSGESDSPPILSEYINYLSQITQLDFGKMPIGASYTVAEAIQNALGASLGLLALAFVLSLTLGLIVGVGASRTQPAGVWAWLPPLSTLGLSLPSFYLGSVLLALLLTYLFKNPAARSPLPTSGFGWDAHLILPVLALSIRPLAQTAQLTATLLSSEFRQQYVITARAIGRTWRAIRWHTAFRNILAPVLLSAAGSLRWLLGELVLVEWLFDWPGLGRLLAQTLVTPRINAPGVALDQTVYFLHPELLAAVLTVFVGLFLLSDLVFSVLARNADPRLRLEEGGRG